MRSVYFLAVLALESGAAKPVDSGADTPMKIVKERGLEFGVKVEAAACTEESANIKKLEEQMKKLDEKLKEQERQSAEQIKKLEEQERQSAEQIKKLDEKLKDAGLCENEQQDIKKLNEKLKSVEEGHRNALNDQKEESQKNVDNEVQQCKEDKKQDKSECEERVQGLRMVVKECQLAREKDNSNFKEDLKRTIGEREDAKKDKESCEKERKEDQEKCDNEKCDPLAGKMCVDSTEVCDASMECVDPTEKCDTTYMKCVDPNELCDAPNECVDPDVQFPCDTSAFECVPLDGPGETRI